MNKPSSDYAYSESGKSGANTNFKTTEAYKSIRTNLLFTLANAQNKIIVTSSPEPGTGKSTISYNLSRTMALSAERVLLIDADMRKPMQHKLYKVPNSNGLSKLLSGDVDVAKNTHFKVAPSLDLITAGPIPPNPSELLGSKRMAELLEALSDQYDYIFIDTPPVRVVTDALLLAHLAAGIVLVVRQRYTTYEDLEKAVGNIKDTNFNVLGVIVNDVHSGLGGYYY